MMKTCWVFMGMNQETWWFHWIEATKMMISYDFDGMRKMKNRDLLIFSKKQHLRYAESKSGRKITEHFEIQYFTRKSTCFDQQNGDSRNQKP